MHISEFMNSGIKTFLSKTGWKCSQIDFTKVKKKN